MTPHRFDPSGDPLARLENPQRTRAVPAADVVGRMGLRRGDLVLDIGAGTGYFSLEMARTGARVLALDAERRMLSVVRGRSGGHGLPDLMSVLGDATSIPVKRSSVRHVLLAFLYHEVGDRNALLRACRDVLEPRGRLTIVDFQKMETGFGPPVAERVAPDEVLRDAASLFILVSRHDAEAYYQLALERM